jgi:hypothetical protein
MTAPELAMRFVLSGAGLMLCRLVIGPIRRQTMAERPRQKLKSSLPQPPMRGRPFELGNPGRPPGSKNKTTKMLEALVEGEAEKLTRKHLELALAGDIRCLHYCLDRLHPQRRGRALDLQLPKINGVNDIPSAMSAIAAALNDGDLSAEEASHLVRFFESYANAFIVNDFAIRLQNVESQMKMMNTSKNKKTPS